MKMSFLKPLLILVYLIQPLVYTKDHSISKRYILFPRYSVLQFTYGLSVPVILPSRSINLSWCVQANFDYPWNLTNFEIMNLRSEDIDFDLDRVTFYEYVVNILEGFGLNGEQCLLKSICEVSETPLHLDTSENLLEKIVHYLLTPSIDIQGKLKGNNTLSHKVLAAEELGKSYEDCDETFNDCDISLVDIFTKKFLYFG